MILWVISPRRIFIPKAVKCILPLAVILAVAQLSLQASFHKLGHGLLEQILDAIYAADVCRLQQLTDFSHRAFSSEVRFFLTICKTSYLAHLLYHENIGLPCQDEKYQSDKGEVGKTVPNLLNQDFYVERSRQKRVADVT